MELSPARVVSLLVLASAVLTPSGQANLAVGRGQLEMVLRDLTAASAEIVTLKETIRHLEKSCLTLRERTTSRQQRTTTPCSPTTTTPRQPTTTTPRQPTTTTTEKNGKMPFMPYDFDWGVRNEKSGNIFSHSEKSGGQDVKGEYRVLLPDGRTQVVTFWADEKSGYNAKVKYAKTQDQPRL